MKRIDLAYLAGFFDGEGAVFINQQRAVRISVCNTDPRPLEKFVEHFGGRIYATKTLKPNHKQLYKWQAACLRAAVFLKACMPFFIVKRERAELALAYQATKRKWGKKKKSAASTLREADIATKMKELNRRGTDVPFPLLPTEGETSCH